MSSQPAPPLAQAGNGHWRYPLYEEEEGGVKEENGGGGYMWRIILI